MIPGVAIRTTVIVGFPGETEAEFSELLEFLEETPLERVGVFTYSPQEGTRAYEMADDVPDEVKRERAERVEQLQRQVTAERYDRMVGRVVRGMLDRVAVAGEPAQARIYAQADDIDGVTWVDTVAGPGSLIDVLLSGVSDDYDFQGEVVRIVADGTAAQRPSARRALPLAPSAGSHSYGKPWPA
jgi:ribosomal protein S12 methylthiotransferase